MGEVMIGRLATTVPHGTRWQWRSRLSNALSQADLHPSGIAPSAILVVRHLPDPLPQHIVAAQSLGVTARWERQVRQRLGAIARRAARPQRGRLPTAADAVLFSDYAELLACFALAQQGGWLHHWWWRHVAPTLERDPATIWRDNVRYLPAAMTHLHQWGEAERVLQTIPPTVAVQLVREIAAYFVLPMVSTSPTVAAKDVVVPSVSVAKREIAPWSADLQLPPLPKKQQALLAVALSVQRQRRSVYRPTFWQQLTDWWDAPAQSSIKNDTPLREVATPSSYIEATEMAHSDAPIDGRVEEMVGDEVIVELLQQQIFSEESAEPIRSSEVTRSQKNAISDRNGIFEACVPAVEQESAEHPEPTSPPFEVVAIDVPAQAEQAQMAPLKEEPRIADTVSERQGADVRVGSAEPPPIYTPIDEPIATQLAGVFYLINLMPHFDFAAAIEQLGAWVVLDLLARGLVGDALLVHDPLWLVLAWLGGREIHESYPAPTELMFRDLQISKHALGRMNSRLRENDRRPLLLQMVNDELWAWLRVVLGAVGERLRGALGEDNLTTTLLRGNGKLHLTRSHIDVVLPLNAIALPVRMAGLDRDPGWQPLFGRVIHIHFTDEGFHDF